MNPNNNSNNDVTVTLKYIGWGALSGALDALVVTLVDPTISWEMLGRIALFGAIKGAALVWKQRPGLNDKG